MIDWIKNIIDRLKGERFFAYTSRNRKTVYRGSSIYLVDIDRNKVEIHIGKVRLITEFETYKEAEDAFQQAMQTMGCKGRFVDTPDAKKKEVKGCMK